MAVAIVAAATAVAAGLYLVSHALTAVWMIAALAAMFAYEVKTAWMESDDDKQN